MDELHYYTNLILFNFSSYLHYMIFAESQCGTETRMVSRNKATNSQQLSIDGNSSQSKRVGHDVGK